MARIQVFGGNSHQRAVERTKWEKEAAVLAPLIAKEMAPTGAKRSPWYQSTLFWGAFGIFGTTVFTVVAAMTKDIRWGLYGALPFASIAIWELLSYFVVSKKRRVLITSLASLPIFGGLIWLYVALRPPVVTQATSTTTPTPKQAVPQHPEFVGIDMQNAHSFGANNVGVEGADVGIIGAKESTTIKGSRIHGHKVGIDLSHSKYGTFDGTEVTGAGGNRTAQKPTSTKQP
jgi:hypothetical protein